MTKNADEPDRRVLFAKPAQADLVHLKTVGFNKCHWQSLRANLERLAGCSEPGDEPNVELMRMCDRLGGKWYRWKQPCIPCEPGIRVAFQVTDSELVVWACLPRNSETYFLVEQRLRKWLAGVL